MPVINRFLYGGVMVGAICGATMAMADAGMLNSRRHTSNDLQVLRQYCPGYAGVSYYVDEPAVLDGNLVTASGIAPVEFAFQVLKKLGVMRENTLEAWYQLYTTRNADHYYSLAESLNE